MWFDDLLREDLASFIGKTLATTDPGAHYKPNWHIELIAEYLAAASRGEVRRLIINMPPRALKSVCVSVAWPAWLLGHDPRRRIMAASYASGLSVKHSLDCRLVVQSSWYRRLFTETQLVRDQNEKHKFMTDQRGFRFATSVGGTITGEGGNFLILDDPQSPRQAMNRHGREMVNSWFEHTFASRLDDKDKGVIVLVMQRLHQDDLSGYLLDKGGWEHLCLPMVADRPTLHDFGAVHKSRAAGELLHEEREGQAAVTRAKHELGSFAYAAQYQQQPLAEEGGMLRPWWLLRYAQPPAAMRVVQSWDTAIKAGIQHDASACLTFGESEGKSYLLHVSTERLEYPDLKRAFFALAERFRPSAILLEDKASGQQLLQDVRREAQLPVIARKPRQDKLTRFAGVSAMIEAGRLVLPEQAAWLTDFEQELLAFPATTHDDQVDALTQYLEWLRESSASSLRLRQI